MKHPLWNRFLGIAFMGLIVVCYVIIIPPAQLYLWIRNRKREMAWLGNFYFKVAFRLFGVTPQVTGLENIPKGRAFIVLSNHQSFIDIGNLISTICPLAFLAKKELFTTPGFGNSLKFMGCIPIDRGNRKANEELPGLLQRRVREGHYNYCIFPEGTRSPDGQLLQFKNGIFKIIHSAPVPVLPVTLIDTGKVMPKRGLALYRKHPRIVIHPIIEPEQIQQWTQNEFRDHVRAAIESAVPTSST